MNPRFPFEMSVANKMNLPAQWQIQPGNIEWHAVHFLIKGEAHGHIAGDSVELKPGDLFWIQPGVERHIQPSSSGSPLKVYFMRFRWLKYRKQPISEKPYFIGSPAWHLESTLQWIVDVFQRNLPHKNPQLRSLTSHLCFEIVNSHHSASQTTRTFDAEQRKKIYNFMNEHIQQRPRPRDFAEHTGLSYDYFSRLFQATFNRSIRDWIKHERIKHTEERLKTSDLSIQAIADEYGYTDVYLFSKQFKAVTGLSPRAYRQMHT